MIKGPPKTPPAGVIKKVDLAVPKEERLARALRENLKRVWNESIMVTQEEVESALRICKILRSLQEGNESHDRAHRQGGRESDHHSFDEKREQS